MLYKKELKENIDYRVDWENFRIVLFYPLQNISYGLALYYDELKLRSITANLNFNYF